MNTTLDIARRHHIEGVIRHVDIVNRDVSVFTTNDVRVFDVPASCAIRLNGERVKLRLLQPRDRVRLTYMLHNEICTAVSIDAGIG